MPSFPQMNHVVFLTILSLLLPATSLSDVKMVEGFD
jgi:hypothetical protein